jgi:electron transfer flavoprotein beta subunit
VEIAVLVKQVPDTDEVKMDPERGTMIREGVGAAVNPLDLNAVEEAVRLVGRFGGRVTAFSMGPLQAEEALRETLALGADRAVLVSDRLFAGSDSWATSVALARTLLKLGPFDLILSGGKATDGETGQVGPEVAALLDLPCATYVSGIELETGRNGAGGTFAGDSEGPSVSADGATAAPGAPTHATVRRTTEEGILRQRLPLPALLAVLNDLNEPPMPTLAGKKRGRRAQIEHLGAAELELDRDEAGLLGSPTRVVRIESPKVSRNGEVYSGRNLEEGLDRVVGLLRDLALI